MHSGIKYVFLGSVCYEDNLDLDLDPVLSVPVDLNPDI